VRLSLEEKPLKPCKHCGFIVSLDEPDFLYPTNFSRTEWDANCYETAGGCGHFESASSPEGALERWNAELAPGEKPHYPV
jgi:hypothetical protein